MENIDQLTEKGWNLLTEFGPKVVGAILVLIIGLRIIKVITKQTVKIMEKRDVDETLRPFMKSLVSWGLKALLVISVAGMVGIATTSFVAVLGAAGLAIGLAFQGSLANLAGGVLLLIFKPFKVGDLIEAQGHLGVVEEIQIFVTKILTPQNRLVILPNGALSNGSMKNYSAKEFVRIDLTFGISYSDDIAKAKEVLLKVLSEHPKSLEDPAPFVGVSGLGDSSVEIAARPHCHPDDYWDVYFDCIERGKIELEAAGIVIPFPQRDVHLHQNAQA
ncbi:mechanosensitive ion channel [Cryomorphaceae bacterium]|nr:mechanosensitive ion channel [Cryomorphaceae bacterium]